jgi:transcriptional regulator with XRE-family HTH domain
VGDLSEALDAALRARYTPRGLRRPVSHRQGLNAHLNALQKQFPTQKALAAALGVGPQAIRRWRAGTQKPSAATQRKIEAAYVRSVTQPEVRRRLKNLPPPNSVTVTAIINWNGYKNRQEHRSTTLGGMRGVMARVIRAWATAGPQAAADTFERGAAAVHNTPSVKFEGDDVDVSIPWEA